MDTAKEQGRSDDISQQSGQSPVDSPNESTTEHFACNDPLPGLSESLAVLLLVVLCDVTIYRGEGLAGYALLFVTAPMLLFLGSCRRQCGGGTWIVGTMIAVLAAKMLWCGSEPQIAVGFALIVAFAMSLSGFCPHVLEVGVFASQTILAGYAGLAVYRRALNQQAPAVKRATWLNFALPLAVFVLFSILFVLANPNLSKFFGDRIESLLTALREWIIDFSPPLSEFFFWLAVVWFSVGLLRPVVGRTLFEERTGLVGTPRTSASAEASLYEAYRNTLLTVIALFAVYLVFEFKTLWFRVFPAGFYYSGYAHEGAAWLTVALALSTLILSVVFRGEILREPRLPRLRSLAWIWSLENVLLAIAVYHRLSIYIGFNGMTRMRIVGLFGMTAVLVGFFVVLRKLATNRNFVWLLRRHLWTLAITIYLFAVTPIDMIVVNYNVRRVLSGDPAPSVQISVHPISSEGVLLLQPLLSCDDKTIREGVRAMLAQRQEDAEELAQRRQQQGWTSFQIADEVLLQELRAASSRWAEYIDRGKRDSALKRFHDYAYQWY